MELLKIVQAYQAISILKGLSLPFPKAYELRKLCSIVQTEYDFYCQEEQKLIKQYAVPKDDGTPDISENGTFRIARKEDASTYHQKILELGQMEIQIDFETVSLCPEDIGRQRISVKQLEALEPFVTVEG